MDTARRAVEAMCEQTRDTLLDAVARNGDEVDALLDAALDYAARAQGMARRMPGAVQRGDLAAISRIASALAALSRLAESRVMQAVERQRAGLELADRMLDATPQGRSAATLRKLNLQRTRRARRKAT